jgi:integrase
MNKGCRPLNEIEAMAVIKALTSTRDKLLFCMGIRTGYRISELLSLKLEDVYDFSLGIVKTHVKVSKRSVKGKAQSRQLPMHSSVRETVNALVQGLAKDCRTGSLYSGMWLFQSRVHGRAISRNQAHVILKRAYAAAKLEGPLACHTMRKSFAKAIYNRLGHDLIQTSHALGHSSVSTTQRYLPEDTDAINAAILAS